MQSHLVRIVAVLVLLVSSACQNQRGFGARGRARNPKCLVLSVGGTAGIAHLGAIEVLRENGVEVSCVVGNSIGSIVGALVAADPHGDTTAHFRAFTDQYSKATKAVAEEHAFESAILGFFFFGPGGAIIGGGLGGMSVDKLNHKRVERVLNDYLRGAMIEDLPVPFETSHVTLDGSKIRFVTVTSGNVARAAAASAANPFIFDELDVRNGGPIDPGLDRVAGVPIEHACSSFPSHDIIAINVSDEPAFVSTAMNCAVLEIRVPVPNVLPEAALTSAEAFELLMNAGREATRARLASPEGRAFLGELRRRQKVGRLFSENPNSR